MAAQSGNDSAGQNNQQFIEAAEPEADRLVEAQGWMLGEQGEVILIAEAPTLTASPGIRVSCDPNLSATR
ncbi:hypothetical protein [Leptolyngbya ohadii]|uniref:hypothetical protein n=1 Tax=Leptolyngbya ohadii TaxID=1962290 RepID=UPI000B59B8C8|nr:hypothetical protein [Leptolyngbya ohadii]